MIHIVFNVAGLLMCIIGFASAFVIGHAVGIAAEGFLMMIAGPLCAALDLGYRYSRGERRWFNPRSGGTLFFVPVWIFGILWLALGIAYTVRAHG